MNLTNQKPCRGDPSESAGSSTFPTGQIVPPLNGVRLDEPSDGTVASFSRDSQASTSPGHSHLRPLTSVRFLAALLVVVFHAFNTFSAATLLQWPGAMINIFQAGYVGVSLFFILSGFILAYNYLDQDLTSSSGRSQFYVSRLARIYPVYLLGLVVAAPKFLYGLLDQNPGSILATLLGTGIPVFTLTQAWIPDMATAWNAPGWSLSAEAFFYLVFPFVALRVREWRGTGRVVVGLMGCWVLALVGPGLYYLLIPGTPGWGNFLKFNPLLRLPEFLMGVCLGKLFLGDTLRRMGPYATSGLWVVTVLVCLALSVSDRIPKYLLFNGLLDPLFAIGILSLALISLTPGWLSRLLSRPVPVMLGEASYALYILHWPLQWLMAGVVNKLAPALLQSPSAASALFLLHLLLCLSVSILAFRFLEVPGRRWVKDRYERWVGARTHPTAALTGDLSPHNANPS